MLKWVQSKSGAESSKSFVALYVATLAVANLKVKQFSGP